VGFEHFNWCSLRDFKFSGMAVFCGVIVTHRLVTSMSSRFNLHAFIGRIAVSLSRLRKDNIFALTPDMTESNSFSNGISGSFSSLLIRAT